VLNKRAAGPLKGLGFMLVRGVQHTEGREYSDEDEDEETEQKPHDGYTDTEMEYMRCIVITQRRADELESMKELVLGDQAGHALLTFSTSFSYEVMDSFEELRDEVEATRDYGARLDKLFAYRLPRVISMATGITT
jgi:hypothetical protein